MLQQRRFDLHRIRTRQVNFINSDHNRHFRSLRMADSFHCLRHNTVIGSHHQNNDIGYFSTTGTHFGKCHVSRGINESNFIAVRRENLISTDVLGNTAGLTRHNISFAQSIQQRGLTVVNVSHNRHNRCTRQQLIRGIFCPFNRIFDITVSHAFELMPQFLNHNLCRIGINRLVNGSHNP